jgi:hypothetical protein
MGCDIHIVLESRKRATETAPAGPWIGLWCSDYFPGSRPTVARRNYEFFAAVASVRGEGRHRPRNLPEDISPLAWREYMRAPLDHHSASHMPATSFVDVYQTVNPPADGVALYGLYRLLCADRDEDEHRVVFWFDN